MDTAEEITKVNFGLLSPEKIEGMSAYEVTTHKLTGTDLTGSLYDPRAGVIDAGENCQTCKKRSRECPGHFGFIRLPRPVLHPLMKGYIVKFLNILCHSCYAPVVDESALPLLIEDVVASKILDSIVTIARKTKCCMHCEASLGNYSLSGSGEIIMTTGTAKNRESIRVSVESALAVLESFQDGYIRLCGIDPVRFHPRSLILQNVPVISLKARPPVFRAGQKCDDQLTAIYASLMRAIAQETDSASNKRSTKTTIETALEDLFSINKTSGSQQLLGLPTRLSGKKGTIRGNAVGKRANFSGRTVTGPDPFIRTNEVLIPPEMWQTLTKPVRVCQWNIDEVQQIVDVGEASYVTRNGKCKRLDIIMNRRGTRVFTGDEILRNGKRRTVLSTDQSVVLLPGDRLFRDGVELTDIVYSEKRGFRVQIGDVIDRYIRDGDYIITNRQPSLHRGGMKALKMRRAKVGSTIRVPLPACGSFNMDYDGDEANVHVPQGIQADVEIAELMSEERNIVSDKSSSVLNTPIQEGILGMWLLSTENPVIERSKFFRLCMRLVEIDVSERLECLREIMDDELYTGRGLISTFLPVDFYFESSDVTIFSGVLVEGVINKKIIKQICHAVYNRYGAKMYLRVVDNMQYIANEYLVTRGITVHLGDLVPRHTQAVQAAITRTLFEVESLETGICDKQITETRKLNLLNNARDAGMSATKDALTRQNNIIKITESGAKGAKFNVAQIHAGLGQQVLDDGIVKPTLNQCTRVIPHQPLQPSMHMKYECSGFVQSSFARGLSPREALFHAQVGRKDIAATSIGTQETGYMQRRMVKRGERAITASNGMVLGHDSAVIQPVYGEDGGDSQELIRVKGQLTFCDVTALVMTLNNEYELTLE